MRYLWLIYQISIRQHQMLHRHLYLLLSYSDDLFIKLSKTPLLRDAATTPRETSVDICKPGHK